MMKDVTTVIGCLLVAITLDAQMKPQPGKGSVRIPNTPSNSPVQITPVAPTNAVAAARRINRVEAEKLVKAGKAVYVDVRSKESYDKGHIKGAVSAPRSELLQKIRQIPPGKTLITYCACENELTAAIAVNTLTGHGVKNSAALIGGWNEWVALGLPIEKTK